MNFNFVTPSVSDTQYNYSSEVPMDHWSYNDHFNLLLLLKTFFMIFNGIAFLFGVLINSAAVWIIGLKMKMTMTSVWFLNLAVAHLIHIMFIPFNIAYFACSYHWPFGTFLCKSRSAATYLSMFACIFFLTIISLDQCFLTVWPIWSKNHRTKGIALVVTLFAWILAALFSVPYCITAETYQIYKDRKMSCLNRYNYGRGILAVDISVFICSFLISFAIIVICYTITALKLRKTHFIKSKKHLKIIIAMILTFFLFWFPYHVFSWLPISYVYPLKSSLTFLSTCINPFLYIYIGRDFRETFKRFISVTYQTFFSAMKSINNEDDKCKPQTEMY
ncbi:chemokine-like receptor 1 [Protopterus annectens]|uniref:chemokine-like receptor 1 n=1 Tax=Protopterus annectens TaxID=7888 RepID=UPI001CFA3B72|nr:chemokine-like receptor 1 [Protopterus annectens]